VAEQQPSYKFCALDLFARALYGFDEPDGDSDGEARRRALEAEANQTGDAEHDGMGYAVGRMPLGSGDMYEGKHKDGRMEGSGVYQFADGRTYEGHWHGGMMEGSGALVYGSNNEHRGIFKAGKPHGHGVRMYADGDVYDGEWAGGKKDGRGVYRYANGDTYEGLFHDDMREGEGVLRFADGGVLEGQWHLDAHKDDSAPSQLRKAELVKSRHALYRALMQENDEQRALICDLRTTQRGRGKIPLWFRRNLKDHLPEDMLRKENAALAAFIRGIAHDDFVSRLQKYRATK
jgi:hypothetical protein